MILLNFSHPITPTQLDQLSALLDQAPTRVIDVKTHFDEQQPFVPQVSAMMEEIPLTTGQWQGEPILVVLPALNFIAGVLLAELHGRMGYFPPVVRTRPIPNVLPRQFEVAEILDLQSVRENARKAR